MSQSMAWAFGFEKNDYCVKQKYRWLFKIPDISASGINSLPPSKSARPSISFKTMEILHLTETIARAARPEWKPVNLVLYDLVKNRNPVFQWLTEIYDPSSGNWYSPGTSNSPDNRPSLPNGQPNPNYVPGGGGGGSNFIVSQSILELYDGCGNTIETWVYENVWPESIDFTDLDMASGEVVCVNLTLHYDRAYIQY